MMRRVAAGGFSARLAEGWYPSAPLDDEGVVRHDRHVLTNVRSMEAIIGDAADLIDRLSAMLVDAMGKSGRTVEQAAEYLRIRNLHGNAMGAVIDAGFTGDTAPHDAIYRLTAERDRLAAELKAARPAPVPSIVTIWCDAFALPQPA